MSPSTLRLWENVGLVSPARSNGRFRLYSSKLLEVLKRIKYLRDIRRLNLPGIKQALGKSLPTKEKQDQAAGAKLGGKLRTLRERSNLTVAEAAQRAGISTGFLSAIELARANPSVATLQRLVAAYDTTVIELFQGPSQSGRLIRRNERRVMKTEPGVRMELLSVGGKLLESNRFVVAPGGGSGGSYSHTGEEFIYMIGGTLEIWLDERESYVLKEGDSFWFESHLGHRWFNPSDKDAVLIWVNTPPSF
jgi:DNA-binding transcriptional MerR regulator/quercetin dioxygenase-like cupin family protein